MRANAHFWLLAFLTVPEHFSQQRTRPRKRPLQARAQQTVEDVVEAAARILEGQGHDGFTTNAVAERAGVSIGTLYQYFPNKEALVGALIARETARLVHDAELASAQAEGLVALDTLIGAAVGHQLRRPALARLLDFEEGRLPFDAETRRVRERFEAVLANILARPDLPPQSDLPTATADVGAIIRGMLDAAGERGEHAREALAARVRRAVVGYLQTAPSDGCQNRE